MERDKYEACFAGKELRNKFQECYGKLDELSVIFQNKLSEKYNTFIRNVEEKSIKEKELVADITNLISTDLFYHTYHNKEYAIRIDELWPEEEKSFEVLHSEQELRKIYNYLQQCIQKYETRYKQYVNTTKSKALKELEHIDNEQQRIVLSKYMEYMLSMEMFNKLTNMDLL